MRLSSLVVMFILGISLNACSNLPGMHRINIQQGNAIDEQHVERLKIGMSKEEVQLIMGSPLVNDPFRTDQWLYVYQFRRSGGELEKQQNVTLHFVNNQLQRIDR